MNTENTESFLGIAEKPADTLAAIDDDGGVLTYGQLAAFVRRLAGVLPARQLVFCLCQNRVGALAGYLALYQNRDVPLLLDANIDPALLAKLAETFGPSHYYYPRGMAAALAPLAKTELLEENGYILAATGTPAPAMHQDLSLLLTTSGSTGDPKLVRHRTGNQEANAANVAKAFGWSAAERPICDLPMQYTMGLNLISSNLYAGATLLLCAAPLTSAAFWDFVKREGGTSFTGVPYSFEILSKLKFTKMGLPALRTLSVGGGKLPEKLFEAYSAFAKESGRRFFSSYGTTETSARAAVLPPEMACDKTGSIGKALPGGELLLRDEDGAVIEGSPAEGELCYRGPNVTMGYALRREDLLLGDEFGGEYRTGDVARRDAEGYYYITGRRSRFLKLFGLRVSLDQCEALVKGRFAADCACLGTDSQMEVFITEAALCDEVRRFLSDTTRLPPAAYRVRAVEAIPKQASGKTDYRALAQMEE